MSRVSDEVYEGLRCAVCEERFPPGEIGVAVRGRSERVHRDAPEGCSSPGAVARAVRGWIEGRDTLLAEDASGSAWRTVS